jgi:fatty acid desaturase
VNDCDPEEVTTAEKLGMSISELRQLRADAAREVEHLEGTARPGEILRERVERMIPTTWHLLFVAWCVGLLSAAFLPGWILLMATIVGVTLLVELA